MSLTHFLLVYDLRRQTLVAVREFSDATEATDAYGQAELAHLGDQDCEIVLVGADSLDTIRKTHGHYFTKAGAVTLPELAAS
jgi:hypothetical protein